MSDATGTTQQTATGPNAPTTCYLLGAGASVSAGFPLARDVRNALETELLPALDGQKAPRLQRWVIEVLEAMHHESCATLDELAWRVHRNPKRWHLVLRAKAVMAALFFHLENPDRLTRYREFARSLIDFQDVSFGMDETGKEHPVVPSNCFVLSYNYDRAFEAAIWEEYRGARPFAKVGNLEKLLNGPLNLYNETLQAPDTMRFSLLKMHGTVGALWEEIQGEEGAASHALIDEYGKVSVDDRIVAEFERDEPGQSPTMVAFPWEGELLRPYGRQFLQRVDEAATVFLRHVQRLVVVGYSFPGLNAPRLRRLLGEARELERVIVIDPDPHARVAALEALARADVGPCEVTHVREPWDGRAREARG